MSIPGRIDVHQHILPPDYAAWLTSNGIGGAGGILLPEWSSDGALDVMNDFGIARSILSVSTPGVHLGDDAEARSMARTVNDYTAQVVRDHPEKFGFFATIISLGGDGLVPVSTLGEERFGYDESARVLEGERTGTRYAVGDILRLRLAEANPLTGALKFELEEGGSSGVEPRGRPMAMKRKGGHIVGNRGRPGNIRHQGKRR